MKTLMLALLSAAVIPHCAMASPSLTGEGATGIRCEFSLKAKNGQPGMRVFRFAQLRGPLQESRLQVRLGGYVLGVATKRGLSGQNYFREESQLYSQLSVREPGQAEREPGQAERDDTTFGMYPWSSDIHTEAGDELEAACELI